MGAVPRRGDRKTKRMGPDISSWPLSSCFLIILSFFSFFSFSFSLCCLYSDQLLRNGGGSGSSARRPGRGRRPRGHHSRRRGNHSWAHLLDDPAARDGHVGVVPVKEGHHTLPRHCARRAQRPRARKVSNLDLSQGSASGARQWGKVVGAGSGAKGMLPPRDHSSAHPFSRASARALDFNDSARKQTKW